MAQKVIPSNLLETIEELIVEFHKEKEACDDYINELMQRNKEECQEISRLMHRMEKLQDLLSDVTNERDDVRLLLESLCDDMQKIRSVATETLTHMENKTSLFNMAVKFYDVKTLADCVEFIPEK